MNVVQRHIAARGFTLTCLCFVGGMITQSIPCYAESIILLKPTATWSVTGKDDVQQLKHLASGVGREFEPNADTDARLKKIGIKIFRCINVDPLHGSFNKDGKFIVRKSPYLLAHLATCREVGATPHIIIAQGLTPELRVTVEDIPESQRGLFGLMVAETVFGPNDWEKFRRYCEAFFHYILIEQNFPDARFEVANEPDIGGAIHPFPPRPALGSRALYEGYFNLYKNVALAATQFEKDHPGISVKLGGPATAWAFTFRFGDFNWNERFLRDTAEQNLKLDFLGVHYYGNISSLDGEYPADFPSFTEMFRQTKEWRDKYHPGLPIWITEWGASYHVNNSPEAVINGNHIGAAWSAAFLNTMLQSGVDGALYLVTTDLRSKDKDGKFENVWGWPSFFVNPAIFGKAYPKAPFHVFDMISRLEGTRVEATRGSQTVNCFASADKEKKRVTVMVWNYGCMLPEFTPAVENAVREAVILRIREADAFFGTGRVHMKRWLVSETVSNAFYLFQKEGKIDSRAELQQVDEGTFSVIDGMVDIGFSAPPSSVSFIEISAQPE
ncbi:MAG: Beta-xylosidase [Syntrophomonadaceae bacterium]|nr:Beta-xylosidase [Bacillota bacterium]